MEHKCYQISFKAGRPFVTKQVRIPGTAHEAIIAVHLAGDSLAYVEKIIESETELNTKDYEEIGWSFFVESNGSHGIHNWRSGGQHLQKRFNNPGDLSRVICSIEQEINATNLTGQP